MSISTSSTSTRRTLPTNASAIADFLKKTFSWLLGVLVISVSLVGCASFPTASSNVAADQLITSDVQSRLAVRTDLEPLSVQTVNGVVYLNGTVVSELERQSAEAAAFGSPSVSDVVNSVSVEPR